MIHGLNLSKLPYLVLVQIFIGALCFGDDPDFSGMNKNVLHLSKTCTVQKKGMSVKDEFLIFINLKELAEKKSTFAVSLNHMSMKKSQLTPDQWEVVRYALIPEAILKVDSSQSDLPSEIKFDYWLAFGNPAVLRFNLRKEASQEAEFEVYASGRKIKTPAICIPSVYLD